MAVAPVGRGATRAATIGVALLDVSTGEFTAAEYTGADGMQALADELAVLKPREISCRDPAADGSLTPRVRRAGAVLAASGSADHAASTPGRSSRGGPPHAARSAARRRPRRVRPRRHPGAVSAAGALVHYLRTTQKVDLAHVRAISYRAARRRAADRSTTLKHLEILEGSEGGRDGSLLDELDRTVTSIGSRLLRAWLLRPLLSLDAHSRSARRGRGAGVPHHRPRQVPRARSSRSRTSSGWWRGPRSAPPGPAIWSGSKQSLVDRAAGARRVLADLQAPLVRSLRRRARRPRATSATGSSPR